MAKVKDAKTDEELLKGRREKQRFQLVNHGLETFTDSQVLEFALGLVVPRVDTHPTGHRLLKEFGSLEGVVRAHPDRLMKVKGIGQHGAIMINFMGQFVPYLVKRQKKGIKIKNSAHAIEYLQDVMKTHSVEEFVLIGMNKSGNIKLEHNVKGSINRVHIYVRDIAAALTRVNSISTIVIAHNHVDENVRPSDADIKLTRALVNLVIPIEIDIIDHLIFGETGNVFSFSENGLIGAFKEEHRKFTQGLLK